VISDGSNDKYSDGDSDSDSNEVIVVIDKWYKVVVMVMCQ
jgi:hypothetical protein